MLQSSARKDLLPSVGRTLKAQQALIILSATDPKWGLMVYISVTPGMMAQRDYLAGT